MKSLFVIFDATFGWLRLIVFSLVFFIAIGFLYLYLLNQYDCEEIRLRNQLISQREIVNISDDIVEKRKLIEYKRDYNNLRQTMSGKFFLGSRNDP